MIISYTYTDEEPIKVEDWIDQNTPDEKQKLNKTQFYKLSAQDDPYLIKMNEMLKSQPIRNYQAITQQYTPEEKESYKEEISKNEPPIIKKGTVLSIDSSYITPKGMETIEPFAELPLLKQTDSASWWGTQQKAIIKNPMYMGFNDVGSTLVDTFTNNPSLLQSINTTVWVYVRAIDKILNLTPYIQSVSTNKGMTNGSWSVKLSGFAEGYVPNNHSKRKASKQIAYVSTSAGDKFFVGEQNTILGSTGELNFDTISKYVQYNDLIFISFEQLEQDRSNLYKTEINPNELGAVTTRTISDSYRVTKDPNAGTGEVKTFSRTWDMIGLVDSIGTTNTFGGSSQEISIQGRDLSKLFTDDGCYFLVSQYQYGSIDNWAFGIGSGSSQFNRLSTGEFTGYLFRSFRTIESMMTFAISQLSNTEIVPDKLFNALPPEGLARKIVLNKNYFEKSSERAKGVWSIVHYNVDPQLSTRRVVGNSYSNADGSIDSFFGRVCVAPFVEYMYDTVGDGFELFVRRPPFRAKDVKQVLDQTLYVTIPNNILLSTSLEWDTRIYNCYGIELQNQPGGAANTTSKAYQPQVFLADFVKYYGFRPFTASDPYIMLKDSVNGEKDSIRNLGQVYTEDLCYLIEIMAHLPFTRTGSITIIGDRRIKVGSYIVLEQTNELFYVTGVSNNVGLSGSVSRTTTISVERGMFVPILKGESSAPTITDSTGTHPATYFNIVDLEGIRNSLLPMWSENPEDRVKRIESQRNKTSADGLNTDVFEWFNSRKYFNI